MISGNYSEEDPPVPISNTVVKLFSADDTWRAAAWESRTSPVISESSSEKDCFLRFKTWLELMQLRINNECAVVILARKKLLHVASFLMH